jgi:hypothetical protein
MVAAALLVTLWAQAEQAPAEPLPAPAAAAPAAEKPPAQPAAVTPPSPAPAPTTAAPATPPPLIADSPPPVPSNSLSVHLRYAYRVGNDSDVTGPSGGMSLGGEYEHRLGAFRGGIELGAAFDFFYDRFSKEVVAPDPTNMTPGMIVDRTLSQTSFALMGTGAWRYADMRVFAGAGAGVAIGYFVSPDQLAGSRTAAQPIARGVFGIDFAIAPKTAAILRVDYSHSFNHQTFTSAAGGTSYPLFGDIFDAGAGFMVRF